MSYAPPRTYTAKRLLEHGPLTYREFKEITGWPENAVESTLKGLVDTGIAQFSEEAGNRRRLYSLAN